MPWGSFITGAATELTRQRQAQTEEESLRKRMAYESMLKGQEKAIPQAVSPELSEYYKGIVESQKQTQLQQQQQQAQKDFETKSKRFLEMTSPEGKPYAGMEVMWHKLHSDLLGQLIPLSQSGALDQAIKQNPQQVKELNLIKNYSSNPNTETLAELKTLYEKGVPKTKEILKKPPSGQMTAINQVDRAINRLEGLISSMETEKFKTGPLSLRFQRGKAGNIYAQYKGTPKEVDFKAKNERFMNEYITAQTGAQRGFKEMAWLATAVPNVEQDLPENFLQKAKTTLSELKQNKDNMVNLLQQSGYQMGTLPVQQTMQPEQQPMQQSPELNNLKSKYGLQ